MNEADTRARRIDPALALAGWTGANIRREFPVGRGRADYVLYDGGRPVAVVETKALYRSARDGLEQAARYARELRVPAAFATNGHAILLLALDRGSVRTLAAFPGPAELRAMGLRPSAPIVHEPVTRPQYSPASPATFAALTFIGVGLAQRPKGEEINDSLAARGHPPHPARPAWAEHPETLRSRVTSRRWWWRWTHSSNRLYGIAVTSVLGCFADAGV